MAGAVIAFDQARPAGGTSFGTPGVARNDLWQSRVITCRSTQSGNASQAWALLGAPAGSAATFTDATLPNATINPDLPGSYRIQLITNGGGPGNVQVLIAAVKYDVNGVLVNRGWRVPAVGEVQAEDNFSGQLRGWSEAIEFIMADLQGVAAAQTGLDLTQEVSNADLVVTDTLHSHVIAFKNLSAPHVLTLPALPTVGQRMAIGDEDGSCGAVNTVTINANGNHIDQTGSTSLVLSNPYEAVIVAWTGTIWETFSHSRAAVNVGDNLLTANNTSVSISDTRSYIVKFKGLTAARTLTLPVTPLAGQRVTVSDSDGSCNSTNTITILGNGNLVWSAFLTDVVLSEPLAGDTLEWNGDIWVRVGRALKPPQRGLRFRFSPLDGLTPLTGTITQLNNLEGNGAAFADRGHGAALNGSNAAFGGRSTLDFADATQDAYRNTDGGGGGTWANLIKPAEFSFACSIMYTGARNYASGQICPQILSGSEGENYSATCGLSCGLDPLDATKVIFGLYVSDSNGTAPMKTVQAVSVPVNVPHYVVGTFYNGNLTIYVDGAAPVVTSGVGAITVSDLSNALQIGAGSTSTSNALGASIRHIFGGMSAWNAFEIAQAQAFLRTDAGL